MRIFLILLIVASFFISRAFFKKQREPKPVNYELLQQDFEKIEKYIK